MSKIGLEIHLNLNLNKKLFCECIVKSKALINTNICEICLGLPGSMPTFNLNAIQSAYNLANYFKMNISEILQFDRKHYMYIDLPKGYQITQYFKPFGKNGFIELRSKYTKTNKKINFIDLKIEEDPAKIINSIVDYNRSGCALLELVTEPDFNDEKEVILFLKQLVIICEDLNIINSKTNSSFKVDVNISIKGSERVEIKNVGSIDDISKCIKSELQRLKKQPAKEIHTRNFIKGLNITTFSRHKETSYEYAFIKEPDLPVINIKNNNTNVETIYERFDEFLKKYTYNKDYIWNLVYNKEIYNTYLKNINVTDKYLKIISKIIKEYNYRSISKNLDFQNYFFKNIFSKYQEYTLKKIEQLIRAYFNNTQITSESESLYQIISKLKKNPIFADALLKINTEQKAINYIIGEILKINSSIDINEIKKYCYGINNF